MWCNGMSRLKDTIPTGERVQNHGAVVPAESTLEGIKK